MLGVLDVISQITESTCSYTRPQWRGGVIIIIIIIITLLLLLLSLEVFTQFLLSIYIFWPQNALSSEIKVCW